MNLLIIGGTVFLGRHLVQAAQEHGHTVTLLNRGKHNPDLFPHLEKLRADRSSETELDTVLERRFDAVIDTCGYVPRIVGYSAARLTTKAEIYCFISSVSVYAGMAQPGLDESSALGALTDPATEEITGETYGPLKALCEGEVGRVFPHRALIIRPGLIVGPEDPSDRFTYWPHRIAQGGRVLAPGKGNQPVQIIDVRDLAEWTVRLLEDGKFGTYNAVGPDKTLTMRETLETCRAVCNPDTELRWAPEAMLKQQEVGEWQELPLWVSSDGDSSGLNMISNDRAIADCLTFRPLADTVRDTMAWDKVRSQEGAWKHTLTREKEQAILSAL